MVSTKFLLTLCIVFSSNIALAGTQPSDQNLSEVFDLCLDLPSDQNRVVNELGKMGWANASDNKIAFEAIYSVMFLRSFRENDLEYTFKNAAFMASSILGNSALKGIQPGFRYGKIRLTVIGIKNGNPQCLFSGPKRLATVAKSKWDLDLDLGGSEIKSSTGFSKDKSVVVGVIDKEKLPIKKSNVPQVDIARNEVLVEQILQEAIVVILPTKK
jgi:hypothetical protein